MPHRLQRDSKSGARPTIPKHPSRVHVHTRGCKVVARVESSCQAKPTQAPCLRGTIFSFATERTRHEAPAYFPLNPVLLVGHFSDDTPPFCSTHWPLSTRWLTRSGRCESRLNSIHGPGLHRASFTRTTSPTSQKQPYASNHLTICEEVSQPRASTLHPPMVLQPRHKPEIHH